MKPPDPQFLIEVDDDGIRPAGRPDQCFYCKRRVGQFHGPKCVVVVRTARYEVILLGQVVGTVVLEDPAFWDDRNANSHKNESAWCASNCVSQIEWANTTSGRFAKKKTAEIEAASVCVCEFLEFRRTEVSEPFKALRKES